MKLKVKICCISTIAEAKLAIEVGASAIGLVSEMPSGPGVISESLAAEIAQTIPPGVTSFLLTCQTNLKRIISQQRTTRVNAIQLCEKLDMNDYKELKKELPGISLFQVIHVVGEESVKEAVEIASGVHGILLDSGNPNLSIKELGGTGRIHNWEISRKICNSVHLPVYLAGGLDAGNVAQAISAVLPFGVDVCSGVRTSGRLDLAKLTAFMDALREDSLE
jgi:phosphoribosylanthranilate isomerase